MRKAILGAASALALTSPAVAADLQVTPYSENPGYEQEVPPYAYEAAPPYAYEAAPPYAYGAAPPYAVAPPVIVARPPVVVDEYPVYAAPFAYAYAGPVWRGGWGWGLEVTSAAVGKVPDMQGNYAELLPLHCGSHVRPPKADTCSALAHVR
jgi:hypothetical protein